MSDITIIVRSEGVSFRMTIQILIIKIVYNTFPLSQKKPCLLSYKKQKLSKLSFGLTLVIVHVLYVQYTIYTSIHHVYVSERIIRYKYMAH